MTAPAQTIAVVGSTPFAWLLAGLLAADHSRAIVLVSDPVEPHRLFPSISLSIAPVTRPETWSLLSQSGPATARRLSKIAPGLTRRGDMRLLARSGEGKLALSHIRHMAPGFGYTVEPHAFDGASALRIRDIWGFDPAAFMSAAPAWLAGANVGVVSARSGLRFRRDGTASFASTELDKVILADDAAIIELLAEDEVAGFASASDHIAILTTPVAPAPLFTVDLDSGGTLVPLAHGTVHGSAPDIGGDGLSRIANCLPAGAGARLAARHRSKALLTHDGAPAFGPLRRNGPYVIAGFGPLDIVLAPLLARLIAGGGTALEAEWAAAHHTQLRQPRPSVAEYHPRAVGAGA